MNRREVLSLLGAGAAAAILPPGVARAQPASVPLIGYFGAGGNEGDVLVAFGQGLREAGYVVGQNVRIDYAWGEGQYDRLAALAADLVGRRVNVIAASPTPAARAAKAATSAIPIVFAVGTDPVEAGLVTNLAKPGGNVTGVSFFTLVLMRKRIELIHELVPPPAPIAVLVNPSTDNAQSDRRDAEAAAGILGRQVHVLEATSASEIDAAFAAIARQGARAFVLGNDPFLATRRAQLAALATRYLIPSMFPYRAYAAAGGLMSYGASRTETARQHGSYVGRVLNGEKPGALPVLLPTKFELVVNLKAAKAIGLTIPKSFLLRADEVIE